MTIDKNYFRNYFDKSVLSTVIIPLNNFAPYNRALHIECGDGQISQFIQADEIHGIDSDEFESAGIIKRIDEPDKVYDLIFINERDYSTYNEDQIYEWAVKSAARIIAVMGTENYMSKYNFGKKIHYTKVNDIFNVNVYEFDENLRVYE